MSRTKKNTPAWRTKMRLQREAEQAAAAAGAAAAPAAASSAAGAAAPNPKQTKKQKQAQKQAQAADAAHAPHATSTCGSSCSDGAHSHGHGSGSHGHSHSGHSHGGHTHASASGASSSSSSAPAGAAAPAPAAPFRCAVSRSMGRSLVATRAIRAGEMILREWPAAMIHFRNNARQVRACAECARFVGTLMDQLNALMRASSSDSGACTTLPVLAAEDLELCPIYRCENAEAGCDDAYCSEAHRQRAWKRGHRLLCVGATATSAASAAASAAAAAVPNSSHKRAKLEDGSSGGSSAAAAAAAAPSAAASSSFSGASAGGSSAAASSHPYALFIAHAERQHEFFIGASKIAAQIVAAIEDGATETEAIAPFAAYVQRPWWEIVAPDADRTPTDDGDDGDARASAAAAAAAGRKRRRDDSDEEQDDGESVAAHLRAVVGHSFALLRTALFDHRGASVAPFFTLSWYASLVGALRLNSLAVEHPSPLRDYAEVADQRLRHLERQAHHEEQAEKEAKAAEMSDEDEEAEQAQDEGEGDEQADSSSSSSDDDEDDDNDDDDGGESRRLRLVSAASTIPAADQRRSILMQLMPLLSRAMRVRLEEKLARKRVRAAARLAAVLDQDEDQPSGAHSAHAHARIRKADRDSYPTQSYDWLLRYSRRHAQRLEFSTRLFPSLHASALYPTVAQANHSCEPNASVEHGQDAEAQLHATRDIASGEQIFLSYINEDQSKSERRADLRDYGFVCQCQRCQTEESEQEEEEEEGDDGDDDEEGEGEE